MIRYRNFKEMIIKNKQCPYRKRMFVKIHFLYLNDTMKEY